MTTWKDNNGKAQVFDLIRMVTKVSAPERIAIPSIPELLTLMEEVGPPALALEAIKLGFSGEMGDVYGKIDGHVILTWMTKLKARKAEENDNARRMGFGGQW